MTFLAYENDAKLCSKRLQTYLNFYFLVQLSTFRTENRDRLTSLRIKYNNIISRQQIHTTFQKVKKISFIF